MRYRSASDQVPLRAPVILGVGIVPAALATLACLFF
jgi:hypothetical protein